MKRGKDDEKMVGGPMFPRLHVNDTEKGGPRAPPRNKMALYEQLSIPSQRFNHGVLPLNPNSANNMVTPASAGQGSGLERNMFFPHHLPPSTLTRIDEESHARRSNDSNLNTPLLQLEQRDKAGEEDDFQVPVFVHSGKGQGQRRTQNGIDSEKLTPFSPSQSVCSTKLQSTFGRDTMQISSQGHNLRQEVRVQSQEKPKGCMSNVDHSVKSATNLSTRRKMNEPSKEANSSSDIEHQDHLVANFSRLHESDASSQQERSSRPQLEDTGHGGVDELIRYVQKGGTPTRSSDSHSGGVHCNPDEADDDGEYPGDQICGSQPTVNVERSNDDSETSMVDSLSGMDISPDDVVGIIGQKRFWKARRAIVNQQRVFAVQVFELHRLIKVQKLIAASPHLLHEDSTYLGKPSLKGSPVTKLPEYVVRPPTFILKRKAESEKVSNKMECSAENAVGKTSISVKNGSQPSSYGPHVTPPPTPVATDKTAPSCFQQPYGHQWLVPVMSPSEGLIYKPYPGSGFTGTGCGGCGPFVPTPLTGNFMTPPYGMSASLPPHHHHQHGMGILPGAPPIGHSYFSPYAMPVMNPAMSGSAVDQMNRFPGPVSHGQMGQLSGGGASINMQQQSSFDAATQKNGVSPQVTKVQTSKDSELQGSTASSHNARARTTGMGHTAEGRDALSLFPMAHVPEVAPQAHDSEQPTRVIRVVPHNRRSATESAARIFQSIQKERKQFDST